MVDMTEGGSIKSASSLRWTCCLSERVLPFTVIVLRVSDLKLKRRVVYLLFCKRRHTRKTEDTRNAKENERTD